jgi:hypothetical protein
VESAASIEEIRQTEAAAANVYFTVFERRVEVRFARKDVPRIAAHWARFNGRRSAINPGSPRSATDAAGALMNYAYKLGEVESTLAARRLGLSEHIGVLHADAPGRPSFSCDLQEAIRPLCDQHVLTLLEGPLRKREFTEDERGVVRVLAPLTHQLCEAMPYLASVLGPVVEHVAELLAASSPYDVSVPSILSGAKHRAAARRRTATESEATAPNGQRGPSPVGLPPRGRRRRTSITTPPLPLTACTGCGAALPIEPDRARSRRGWCATCLPERRTEIGETMNSASRVAAVAFARAAGALPTHTSEAQAARAQANARQRRQQTAYEANREAAADVEWYRTAVQPRLAEISLTRIAKATGVSTSAASKWRSGRTIPHARHWRRLHRLADSTAT